MFDQTVTLLFHILEVLVSKLLRDTAILHGGFCFSLLSVLYS